MAITLEVIDLRLHRLQRLVHRREGAQHRLLTTFALLAESLIVARLGRQLAVEQLLVLELCVNAVACRLARGKAGAKIGVRVG
jgi:hypothetical protein